MSGHMADKWCSWKNFYQFATIIKSSQVKKTKTLERARPPDVVVFLFWHPCLSKKQQLICPILVIKMSDAADKLTVKVFAPCTTSKSHHRNLSYNVMGGELPEKDDEDLVLKDCKNVWDVLREQANNWQWSRVMHAIRTNWILIDRHSLSNTWETLHTPSRAP